MTISEDIINVADLGPCTVNHVLVKLLAFEHLHQLSPISQSNKSHVSMWYPTSIYIDNFFQLKETTKNSINKNVLTNQWVYKITHKMRWLYFFPCQLVNTWWSGISADNFINSTATMNNIEHNDPVLNRNNLNQTRLPIDPYWTQAFLESPHQIWCNLLVHTKSNFKLLASLQTKRFITFSAKKNILVIKIQVTKKKLENSVPPLRNSHNKTKFTKFLCYQESISTISRKYISKLFSSLKHLKFQIKFRYFDSFNLVIRK